MRPAWRPRAGWAWTTSRVTWSAGRNCCRWPPDIERRLKAALQASGAEPGGVVRRAPVLTPKRLTDAPLCNLHDCGVSTWLPDARPRWLEWRSRVAMPGAWM